MENFCEIETLSTWLLQYGSVALFFMLVLGIVALPIPEETLMVITGALLFYGKLNLYPTLLCAYAGSMCGITVSYFLGRTAGHYILHKFGKWFGLTPDRIVKLDDWYKRYGAWVLFFGYFIPGIRHFSGFSAGMTDLTYKRFALFAYSGALIWVSTFLSVGYFFGKNSTSLLEIIDGVCLDKYALILVIVIVAMVLGLLYFRYRKNQK